MPRTTRSSSKSAPRTYANPGLDEIVAAVVATLQGQTEQTASKPASKRTAKQQTQPAAPRRVKPENVDRAASMRAVCGAFFEAFQVIYGEKLNGWPTLGDLEAIRDDLQARLS